MSRYILISVYDGDIYTENFDSYKSALDKMTAELKEKIIKEHPEGKWWTPITKALLEKGYYLDGECGIYNEGIAWCNIVEDCYCSWKIIEVE